jgi:hypothetical protein
LATVALYTTNSSSKRTIDASQSLTTPPASFELVQAVHNAGYLGAVPVESEQGATRYVGQSLRRLRGQCRHHALPSAGFRQLPPFGGFRNVVSAGSVGVNASDSVAFRFTGWAAGTAPADGSVQNCSGTAVPVATVDGNWGSAFSR